MIALIRNLGNKNLSNNELGRGGESTGVKNVRPILARPTIQAGGIGTGAYTIFRPP